MYKLRYETSKFSFIHVNRHIIYTPIELEWKGILHANLTELLLVDLLPKVHSILALWDGYNIFWKNIAIQREQICFPVDKIVEQTASEIKNIRSLGSVCLAVRRCMA